MALNVTTAVIGGGCQRAVASPSLAQWDRGQILKITGVDLPMTYNVEFCCQGDLTTTTMLGGADGVEIPNLLLQRGLPIIAYLVLHEGQDDRETEYWITIYVKQRAMPPSVTPDPEQADIIDQLVAALDEGVTAAENAAAQAEAQVEHYPTVIDGTWHVWNALTESWVDTEVPATGPAGRGITSVTQNADYTLTLTFTDGTDWTTPTPVRGATGATPNLTIGAVTTGAAGSSAAASITGTAENPVLNLTIPQGLKGDPGNGDAIAPTFSASTAYSAGAYVIYNGSLYRFTAAHAAGAWVGTDAVAAVLGNDVADLKGDINDPVTGLQSKAPVIIDTASGSTASFPDGADGMPIKALTVNIVPQQDLHGQANPYPAGGGVNKIAPAVAETKTDKSVTVVSDGNGAYTISGTATGGAVTLKFDLSAQYTIQSGDYLHMGNSAGNSSASIIVYFSDSTSFFQTLNPANRIYSLADYVGKTITSIGFYVANGVSYSATIKTMVVASSTSIPFAPYSNECPISGHTECDIWDDPAYGGNINWNQIFKGSSGGGNGLTLTVDTSTEKLTISGTASANTYVKQGNIPKSIIGHKYFASIDTSNDNIQFYNDTGGVLVKGSIPSTIGTATGEKDWYCRFANGAVFGTGVSFTPQLIDLTQMFGEGNEPSTVEEFKALFPKAYYAYDSGTVTCVSAVNNNPYRHEEIDFPVAAGTVFGANIQVNEDGTGVLTVDRASFDLDGQQSMAWNGSLGCLQIENVPFAAISDSNKSLFISSTFKSHINSSVASMVNEFTVNGSNVMYVKAASLFTDLTTATSYFTNNPTSFVGVLATPITVQLDPITISTLLGENNIWHDANGETTVDYCADTKLYIDKKLAALVAALS